MLEATPRGWINRGLALFRHSPVARALAWTRMSFSESSRSLSNRRLFALTATCWVDYRRVPDARLAPRSSCSRSRPAPRSRSHVHTEPLPRERKFQHAAASRWSSYRAWMACTSAMNPSCEQPPPPATSAPPSCARPVRWARPVPRVRPNPAQEPHPGGVHAISAGRPSGIRRGAVPIMEHWIFQPTGLQRFAATTTGEPSHASLSSAWRLPNLSRPPRDQQLFSGSWTWRGTLRPTARPGDGHA